MSSLDNDKTTIKICMIYPEIGQARGNPFVGGGVNAVVRLSKALRERGHEVTIITTPHRHPGEERKANTLEGIKIVTIPIYQRYASARYVLEFYLRALIEVIKKRKQFDIIHGHSGYVAPAIVTGLIGKLIRKPSVHTLYSTISSKGGYKGFGAFNTKTFVRFSSAFPDRIIASSRSIFDKLSNLGIPEAKLKFIRPSVDSSFNSLVSGDRFRKEFNLQGKKVLLYVGNMTRSKGLHILIKALREVLTNRNDVHALLVLNMPLDKFENSDREVDLDHHFCSEIKSKIDVYGLKSHITFIGITQRLSEIMAAADIFVLPFLNTVGIVDYPLSLLEAMATGKPVIATRVGGIPEIIKDRQNGFLINPGNHQELTDAIRYMIQNAKVAMRFGVEATKLISREFRAEIIADRMEETYRELVARP